MCRTVAACLTVLVLTALSAHGQPAGRGDVSLAGQVELGRMVDLAAQRLKLNIEYNPADLKGQVTLRTEAGITDEELWPLLNRLLASRGFTTVQLPGRSAYSVVKLSEVANLPRVESGAGEVVPGYKTVVVRAQHRPAKELADSLSKVLSKPGGNITPLGDGGLLIISDLSAGVDAATALLERLDTPGPGAIVEEIPVRNLSAQQLATLIAQVTAKRDALGVQKVPGDVVPSPDGQSVLLVCPEDSALFWREQIAQLDRRDQAETVTYSPRYFPAADVAKLIEQTVKTTATGADERWKLVVDDLTGSLVITARPVQHEQIRALLERLDATPATARRPVRTFVIKNRGVKEIQGILEDLLQAGVLDAAAEQIASSPGPASTTGATSGAPVTISLPPPPATSAPGTSPLMPKSDSQVSAGRTATSGSVGAGHSGTQDRPLVLTADEGTNTLIAVGEPRLLSQVESLLKTLDVRQPQVMLEVLMVTLTDGQTLDLGVELERLTSAGDARIRLSSLFGLGIRGSGGDRTAGDASGFTGVVLSPGEFSIIVRALQTLNEGRAVSMPKLLVTNNQAANLNSVVQQPYASVNASTTVSTTSFGGTQDAGTTVTIKPQIAEGDHLLLDYSVSLSAFLGAASNPNLPPPKQENSVTSVATIPDGYTVVVGGIDLESRSKTTSQIPLLGDIPILGEAFKSRNKTQNSSKFYVFIRANILRNRGFDDLKYISDRAVADAKVDDGWPEVKPRIIR
ncbi:MAG: hypothetical protein IT436_13995 [Phycisphaerales bacterium]|nr:hypothetical protein [Phycisphaerales bacterium]